MAEGEVVQLQQPTPNEYTSLLNEGQQNIYADQPVPQDAWYLGLLSTLCSQYDNIRQLLRGPWCAVFGGKLEALVRCLFLPCTIIIQAADEQRGNYRQSGIVYLSLYLVVSNLVPLLAFGSLQVIQQYFVLGCIVLAIVEMLYLWLITRENLTYRDWNFRAGYPPEALMRVFYQGGLYLFGFLNFGYRLSSAYDSITELKNKVTATVNIVLSLYIVIQILFLNKFFKGRILDDTRGIQIVLAHLLGTNLALWLFIQWHPIFHNDTNNIFSPLFVEYLLIAASLFYQIWQDLLPTLAVARSRCRTCAGQINAENFDADQQRDECRGANGRVISRNLGLGIVIGCCFSVVFLFIVGRYRIHYIAYSGGIITLYLAQIFACYIILLSAQSLAWDRQRTSLDHDDALLYISLVGSLLWEGFRLLTPTRRIIFEPAPLLVLGEVSHIIAIFQVVFQTTTLINLRRHQPTRGRRTTWISQCLLFLLATNISLWIENTFFAEISIPTPEEEIQEALKPIGYIVHPLNIFFRFHSVVCCYIAWSIFRT